MGGPHHASFKTLPKELKKLSNFFFLVHLQFIYILSLLQLPTMVSVQHFAGSLLLQRPHPSSSMRGNLNHRLVNPFSNSK